MTATTEKPFNEFVCEYAKPARILVVEDDNGALEMMGKVFAEFDVQTSMTGTVNAALELMDAEQFDLIILDTRLAGLNISDMARHIEVRQPFSPIVIVSNAIEQNTMSIINHLLNRPVWYVQAPFTFNPVKVSRLFHMLKIRASFRGKGLPSNLLSRNKFV